MTHHDVEQYLLHNKPFTSNTFMDYIPYLRFAQILRVEIRLNQWQRLIAAQKLESNYNQYECTLCEFKGMRKEQVQKHLFKKRHLELLQQNVGQIFHPDYTYSKVILNKMYEKNFKTKEKLNTEKLTQNAGNVNEMKSNHEDEQSTNMPLKDEKFSKILMTLRRSMKSSNSATESNDAHKDIENDEEFSSSRDSMFKDNEEKDDNNLQKVSSNKIHNTMRNSSTTVEEHKLKTECKSETDIKTPIQSTKDVNFEQILNRLRRTMGTNDTTTNSNDANKLSETTTATSVFNTKANATTKTLPPTTNTIEMVKNSVTTTATNLNQSSTSKSKTSEKCTSTSKTIETTKTLNEPTTLNCSLATPTPTLVSNSNTKVLENLETKISSPKFENKLITIKMEDENTDLAADAAFVELNEAEIQAALAPAGYLHKKKLKHTSDLSEPQKKRKKISIKLPSIKVLPTAKIAEDSEPDENYEEGSTINPFSTFSNDNKEPKIDNLKKAEENKIETKAMPKIRLVSIEKLMEKKATTKVKESINPSANKNTKDSNNKTTEQKNLKHKVLAKTETNLNSKAPIAATSKTKANTNLIKIKTQQQKQTNLNSEKLTAKTEEALTRTKQTLPKSENEKKNINACQATSKKDNLQQSSSMTPMTPASKDENVKKVELTPPAQSPSKRATVEKQNFFQSPRKTNTTYVHTQSSMKQAADMQMPISPQQTLLATETIVDDETHKRMVESFLAANNRSSSKSASTRTRTSRTPPHSSNNSKKARLRTPSPGRNSKNHHKKIRNSRSSPPPSPQPSPSSQPSRSSNVSDAANCPKEVHLNPRHPIWSKYCRHVDRDMRELKKRYEKYKKNPELHPSYEDEWQKFWQQRKTEIIAENKVDYRTYDYKADWVPYFKKRIEQFYEEATDLLKIKLREKLSLPLSNRCVLNKKYHVKTHINSNDSSKKSTTDTSKISNQDKTPTFVSVLRLLIALEEHLGSFKQRIVELLEKVLQAEKSSPSEGIALINDENYTLLELIVEKFKGLILLDSSKERILRKPITQMSLFLKVALELKEKTKELILKRATENIDNTFNTPFDLQQHSQQFATVLNFSTQPPHQYAQTNYDQFSSNMYAANWQQQLPTQQHQQQQLPPTQQQFYHSPHAWNTSNVNQTWGVGAPWPPANPSPVAPPPAPFSHNYYC